MLTKYVCVCASVKIWLKIVLHLQKVVRTWICRLHQWINASRRPSLEVLSEDSTWMVNAGYQGHGFGPSAYSDSSSALCFLDAQFSITSVLECFWHRAGQSCIVISKIMSQNKSFLLCVRYFVPATKCLTHTSIYISYKLHF